MTLAECPFCPCRYDAEAGKPSTCPECGIVVGASLNPDHRAISYSAPKLTTEQAIRLHHGNGTLEL